MSLLCCSEQRWKGCPTYCKHTRELEDFDARHRALVRCRNRKSDLIPGRAGCATYDD